MYCKFMVASTVQENSTTYLLRVVVGLGICHVLSLFLPFSLSLFVFPFYLSFSLYFFLSLSLFFIFLVFSLFYLAFSTLMLIP